MDYTAFVLMVKIGDLLVGGTPAPHDILRVLGVEKLIRHSPVLYFGGKLAMSWRYDVS